MLVATEVSNHKSEQGKYQSNRDIACDISSTGKQSEQVIEPDKKEHTEQIRHEPLIIFLANVGHGYFVSYKANEKFQQCPEAMGRCFWLALVVSGSN